jgi:hypothetical protein
VFNLQIGDVAIVFDSKLWGGRDNREGNSWYYKEATVLSVYRTPNDPMRFSYGDVVADVRFHHDGRVSKGHFVDMMNKEIPS